MSKKSRRRCTKPAPEQPPVAPPTPAPKPATDPNKRTPSLLYLAERARRKAAAELAQRIWWALESGGPSDQLNAKPAQGGRTTDNPGTVFASRWLIQAETTWVAETTSGTAAVFVTLEMASGDWQRLLLGQDIDVAPWQVAAYSAYAKRHPQWLPPGRDLPPRCDWDDERVAYKCAPDINHADFVEQLAAFLLLDGRYFSVYIDVGGVDVATATTVSPGQPMAAKVEVM